MLNVITSIQLNGFHKQFDYGYSIFNGVHSNPVTQLTGLTSASPPLTPIEQFPGGPAAQSESLQWNTGNQGGHSLIE